MLNINDDSNELAEVAAPSRALLYGAWSLTGTPELRTVRTCPEPAVDQYRKVCTCQCDPPDIFTFEGMLFQPTAVVHVPIVELS